MFEVVLLTHEREVEKPTNTGRLVLDILGRGAKRIVWQRKQPDHWLLEKIAEGAAVLVYPGSESDESLSAESINDWDIERYFVLIDATWQQARKIYNLSPYLHCLPKVELKIEGASRFKLRRNQKTNGLCTAECVMELMRRSGKNELADRLNTAFENFNEQGR